jgi:hypothetical protein
MSQEILRVLQPEGWAPAKGYANGIAARGEMIFVAGMIGWNGHCQFETDDFVAQCGRGLVECPVCGDASITKKLSAPRLNFGAARPEAKPAQDVALADQPEQAMHLAWMAMARRIVANTDDVGDKFAEEARRIHYGETEHRGIRGLASPDERAALADEGIEVVALPMPAARKGPAH